MIISKEDRRTIYENLFKDGVMVAQKDYNAPKHVELEVPNLHVIKACQSLNSRGFIKTQFSWNVSLSHFSIVICNPDTA